MIDLLLDDSENWDIVLDYNENIDLLLVDNENWDFVLETNDVYFQKNSVIIYGDDFCQLYYRIDASNSEVYISDIFDCINGEFI